MMQEALDHLRTGEAAKSGIAAAVLLVLWMLEALLPEYAARRGRVKHDARNLALALLNVAMVAAVFARPLGAAADWAQRGSIGLVRMADLPPWLRWTAALVLFDLWMYVWHRMNHRIPALWRFHRVHHSDADMDASTALRFHTGEIALSSIARFAAIPAIGISLPQLLVYEAVLLPVILFHHSNVRIPGWLDRPLRVLIVTPWMHRMHHSRLVAETDSNYSSVLSVWDRVFASFTPPRPPAEVDLGLTTYGTGTWEKFGQTLAIPFRDPSSRESDRERIGE